MKQLKDKRVVYSRPTQKEQDLEDIWDEFPIEVRVKIEKLPEGIRTFFVDFAYEYARKTYHRGELNQLRGINAKLESLAEWMKPENSERPLPRPTEFIGCPTA